MSRIQKLLIENANNKDSIDAIASTVIQAGEKEGVEISWDGKDFFFDFTQDQIDESDSEHLQYMQSKIMGDALDALKFEHSELF